MDDVLLCARYELLLAIRSRWLQMFAIIFAVLTLSVAASGYILSGGYGMQDFSRTAESLVQLVILLVPLTSLTFGALALTPERGAAEVLYAQPVPRWRILVGRVIGLLAALTAAQLLGFGIAGLVVNRESGSEGAGGFLIVVAMAIAMTAVFLSVAALLAEAQPRRRARVLASALVVWFAAVVLYDLAALGAASLLRSGTASRLLITAALVNPVDAARLAALIAVEGTSAFGSASLALVRFAGGAVAAVMLAGASVVFWAAAPLAVAARRLSRADV